MNNLNFVQVPMSALIRLNDINLKIYGIIYTSCKLNNNKFYHSYQQFADELCASIRNVKYSIKYLANNGYIEIERGRGIKKPNVYHIPNGAMDCTINSINGLEINLLNTSNGATGCTINGAMDCTQKENKEKIEKKKEKEIYKEKEKRKSVTKDTINLQVLPDNENNNKIKLNMSKQITKNPENGNTPNNLESFLPSENTNPSSLQTNNGNPNDNSHCFSDSGSGCDNPNNLQIQALGRDNTKNGDNPNKGEMNNTKATRPTTAGQNTNPKTAEYNHEAAGATETTHRGFNVTQVDNYPTHTEKTPQEADKWANQGNGTHSPMNCYIPIDELEDIYNGGQTIPKPQSKDATPIKPTEEDVRYLSISKWKQTMRNIQTKVENFTKLNQSDLNALLEGSQDPMRVIDTLKTIKMLINNLIRLKCYWRFLDECEITIPTIRSDKQRKYAKDLLKECDKDYDHYCIMVKKII